MADEQKSATTSPAARAAETRASEGLTVETRAEKAEEARAEKAEAAADKKAEKTEAKKVSGKFGRAGESGDPAVQFALAELQTAQTNRDSLTVDPEVLKIADREVEAAQKRLQDLGYE